MDFKIKTIFCKTTSTCFWNHFCMSEQKVLEICQQSYIQLLKNLFDLFVLLVERSNLKTGTVGL